MREENPITGNGVTRVKELGDRFQETISLPVSQKGRVYTEKQLTALGRAHEALGRLNGYIESAQRYLIRSEGISPGEAVPMVEAKYAGIRHKLQRRIERIHSNLYADNNFEPPNQQTNSRDKKGIKTLLALMKDGGTIASH